MRRTWANIWPIVSRQQIFRDVAELRNPPFSMNLNHRFIRGCAQWIKHRVRAQLSCQEEKEGLWV